MKPYRAGPSDPKHAQFVTRMFDRIAPRYDRLNRIMTFGLDRWWRWRLVRSLGPAMHRRVLDACTGTGDVALALARRGHEVVGVDGSAGMLARARVRDGPSRVRWCRAECLALPHPDGAFDALTIAFGIRNIADRIGALREFARVLRPGGLLIVLEALDPEPALWRWLVRSYERTAFPVLGATFARDREAYEYLASSIAGFGTAAQFEAQLRASGFQPEGHEPLTGGSVVLFRARAVSAESKSQVG